jgi:hypothetical protein
VKSKLVGAVGAFASCQVSAASTPAWKNERNHLGFSRVGFRDSQCKTCRRQTSCAERVRQNLPGASFAGLVESMAPTATMCGTTRLAEHETRLVGWACRCVRDSVGRSSIFCFSTHSRLSGPSCAAARREAQESSGRESGRCEIPSD